MKAKIFTTITCSLISMVLSAGDLDGYWRCEARNSNIEVIYTRDGIKVRPMDRRDDTWDYYSALGTDSYRDRSGNGYTFRGGSLEFFTQDRRTIYNYSRYDRNDRSGPNTDWNYNDRNRDREYNNKSWDRSDRDGWNSYYRSFEGKWHNHTTGTHIHVDLSRKSLRIKFHGERWFEVVERNRGLFVDRKGNEFVIRGEVIEYRSNDGDLQMKFYHDDRCRHRDDYRSEYWK